MVRKERRRALREALDDLERYRIAYDRATFRASRDAQRLVSHALYVAVQSCLDEAQEACRTRKLDAGDRYRECFVTLGKAGALDPSLAGRLSDWASFRNVLAHFYPVLDIERVYDALSELEDLAAFERWILAEDRG